MTDLNPYKRTQMSLVLLVILGLGLPVLLLLASSLSLTLVSALYATVFLLFGWLRVEIDDRFLVCRFGIGLIRKRFDLGEISSVKTVRNRWYYGWGIRWTPHGWLFNAAGLDAVEIGM